jgi:hypothetical protein
LDICEGRGKELALAGCGIDFLKKRIHFLGYYAAAAPQLKGKSRVTSNDVGQYCRLWKRWTC